MSLVSIDVSPPCSEPRYNWIYVVLWSLNAPGPEERECKTGKKMEEKSGRCYSSWVSKKINKWAWWWNVYFSIFSDHLFLFSQANILLYLWDISLLVELFFDSWLGAPLSNNLYYLNNRSNECNKPAENYHLTCSKTLINPRALPAQHQNIRQTKLF